MESNGCEKIKALYINKLRQNPLKAFLGVFVVFFFILLYKIDLDPSQYRNFIEKWVYEHTGQTLVLQGPLKVGYRPTLTIESEDILLINNPLEKKELAKAKRLKITPSLYSLFSKNKIFILELEDVNFETYFLPKLKTELTYTEGSFALASTKINLSTKDPRLFEIDHIQVNTENETPKFSLKHEGKAFQLPLLLSALKLKNKFDGETTVAFHLTAEGKNLNHLKKSLSGEINLEVSHGILHGMDLIASLKKAKSLLSTLQSNISKFIRGESSTRGSVSLEKTPFELLKIKATLKNGIFHHHSLTVKHTHYDLKGSGKINLIENTLNYTLHAIYKKQEHKNSEPLILKVSGNFEKINIEAELDSYFRYLK